MIVGTAGHIDHGKTTLIKALTGVNTDRLKEEQARGISIELGYAYTPLENGDVLGFIDVPGHERLVHTMVAGASGIDFALLVIAADDGVMPQTREHVEILQWLGISVGAVALTKTDRVDQARVAEVSEEIRQFLASSTLAGIPIFPVAAHLQQDAGTAALRRHLNDVAQRLQPRRDDGLFRLAIDRVFTLAGHGTVVTGTIFSGSIEAGAHIALMPSGETARVRSLHVQNRAATSGHAGQRCALNLTGIDKEAIKRGDWAADSRAMTAVTRVDVELQLSANAGVTIRNRSPLHVHLGTSHQVAHVTLLEGNSLVPGNRARVQLQFEHPLCATPGDHFIVRNAQANMTVGGGRVLDPFAPARKRRTLERRAWLDALAQMIDGAGTTALLETAAPDGLRLSTLVQLSGLPPAALALPDNVQLVAASSQEQDHFVMLSSQWQSLRIRAIAALAEFHTRFPDEQGVDAARLRRMTLPALDMTLWQAVITSLLNEGAILRSGPWLHLAEHVVTLSESEQILAQRLLPKLAAARFDPPWVRELAQTLAVPEEQIRQILRKMVRQGMVYQIERDLFYHRDCVRELAQLLSKLVAAKELEHGATIHAGVNAADWRDETGLGRKRAIQILEFFDRVGYTRRVRDTHMLRGGDAVSF
ncbi:selenocysteine-specific translation elongation factor [Collimonas arenae]|uniref:Selenocysteine-specific elongation factor n=1 Tax=Collimonas arenae TaxID=279058 RepID=A0A127QEZ0_9BURK|nr:selenocysteine-specific translation elongation factor [Collimonas arenae]AMO98710.1 selenocysteine-specific translation elongation factor [Collimonas arenae]AMP08601.1 selenocysteine-specific translation elongation factor [Collimonas arenae]